MRSSYPGRKVSVIPTKLQFTILDSARDMVAGSQKGKCELKYVIHSQDFHSLNGSFRPKSTVSRPIFGLISSLFHLRFNYLAWPDHGPSRVVRFGFLFGHYIRAILDTDFFKTTIS